MSTVIFDFDGTIADTFFIAVDVFRTLAKDRRDTSDAEVEVLRGLSAREAIKHVRLRWWQLPYVLYYARRQARDRADEIHPIAGMSEVLVELHKRGHKLFIATTNSTKTVQRFLDAHQLSQYFDGVYGGLGIFNKSGGLRKIAQLQGVPAQQCYYVGDEARDVDTARRVDMPCISVTWGYNNLKGLNRAHPQTVIQTPKELLSVIK